MTQSDAQKRLQEQRSLLQRRVSDLRQSVSRETGWTPGNRWLVPMVGFACGLAMAVAIKGRRNRSLGDGSDA